MKRFLLSTLAALLCVAAMAQLQVKQYTLSNGLRVWLNEDHSQPKVVGAVVVNSGAAATPGTGIAHYLEHVMFKGTDRIGTTDYAAEKVILDSISQQYDLLAATADAAQRAQIQRLINGMSVRAARFAIPNEFDRLIARSGGSGLNAYTNYDQTVFLNTFIPAYMEQWAQLYVERMRNPVFRLFQSELETVYEEKNMYANTMGETAVEKGLERFFAPSPYAYPVIGTTENLKNPRLSQMYAFYKDHYRTRNMGLVLSGDIDAQKVLPILEKTFGQLPPDDENEATATPAPVSPKPFEGEEKIELKIPVPVVQGAVLAWRGPDGRSEDALTMDVAMAALSNGNRTGLLDGYVTGGKLMMVQGFGSRFACAGVVALAAVPKLPFGSSRAAHDMIMEAVGRLNTGDLSDELFDSSVLEVRRAAEMRIEDIDSRSELLFELFTYGLTMEEYLRQIGNLSHLTKSEMVEVASKYLTANRLYAVKKTGKYPPDNVPKPNFAPVISSDPGAQSQYAEQFSQREHPDPQPRMLNFDKDVRTQRLSDYATLYSCANPVNDIFTLNVIWQRGVSDDPDLAQVAEYMSYIGTDSLSMKELRGRLQSLGAQVDFKSSRTEFTMSVTGFDANFGVTMDLVGNLLNNAVPDDKQLKKVVDGEKVERKAALKSADAVSAALDEKVVYGNLSTYLSLNTMRHIASLRGRDLLAALGTAIAAPCDVTYCGNTPVGELSVAVDKLLPVSGLAVPHVNDTWRTPRAYSSSQVFFVDMPGSSQAVVRACIASHPNPQADQRAAARLFSAYVGGDMSSLLFQQIRELRSLVYDVNGGYMLPPLRESDKPCMMKVVMSTQNDKTTDAICVLDSLLRAMPMQAGRVADAKLMITNSVNNDFPDIRQLPGRIASLRRAGNTADPSLAAVQWLAGADISSIEEFYNRNIKGLSVVYTIVGDRRKIDMKALENYGSITYFKPGDLFVK